jgi:hypothetical protein
MRGERVIEYGFQSGSKAESIDKAMTPHAKKVDEIARDAALARGARITVRDVRKHCRYWKNLDLFYENTDGGYRRSKTGPHPGPRPGRLLVPLLPAAPRGLRRGLRRSRGQQGYVGRVVVDPGSGHADQLDIVVVDQTTPIHPGTQLTNLTLVNSCAVPATGALYDEYSGTVP